MTARRWWAALGLGLLVSSAPGAAAQVLETETARPLKAGTVTLGSAFEFQTSSDGIESALPAALEVGLTDRLGVLVEPVGMTSIRPKLGPHAHGVGDMEVTASYLVRSETRGFPALALAAEAKIPTAKNTLIGTGRTDFAGYLILSRRMGRFDTHANLAYTVIGRPSGTALKNIVSGSLAGELQMVHGWELFGEILANSSSTPSGQGEPPAGQGAVVPEASAGELSGTLGAGLHPASNVLLSLSFSVDTNQALLVRPGLTWTFH